MTSRAMRFVRATTIAALAAGTLALPMTTASSAPGKAPRPGVTERVTVSAKGVQSDGDSGGPTLSDDGRFAAFATFGATIVPGDTNGDSDAFVRDLRTGKVTRVSVASDGTQSTGGDTHTARISGNGRYVVLTSDATNLVDWGGKPPTGFSHEDVYVHDRRTGRTERVSTTPDGGTANAYGSVGISDDGRYVAFNAPIARMEGGTSYYLAAYVTDRRTGKVTRISHEHPEWTVYSTGISGNGRYVEYNIRHPRGGRSELMVFDRRTGKEEQANVDSAGSPSQADASAVGGSLSDDGRYIAFSSLTDLVGDPTPNGFYLYVRDLRTDVTRRIQHDGPGERSLSGNLLSGDGRYLAYNFPVRTPAGDFVDNVYLHDLRTGTTRLVSKTVTGGIATEPTGYSAPSSLSRDGRLVGFLSSATDIVKGDTNGHSDGFVRRMR
ncbi:TolB family protein [Streptomyces sp. NPDC002680]|uniref:TolB family protein n=1 Tax=Streptomyces sp. NPDC002680 TaxID=3364659 RepID=UPI0036928A23